MSCQIIVKTDKKRMKIHPSFKKTTVDHDPESAILCLVKKITCQDATKKVRRGLCWRVQRTQLFHGPQEKKTLHFVSLLQSVFML